MRIGFDKAEFSSLAELWNGFYPDSYRLDADLLRAKTTESHLFDWGASIIDADESGRPTAFVAVKKSAAPLYRGPDPDQAHITGLAFRGAPAACELLSYVRRLLVNRGMYKLVFGGDSAHLFPGCPDDAIPLRDFLTVEGFQETGATFDLEADLADYVPPAGALERLGSYPGRQGGDSEPAVRTVSDSDRDALRMFLEREFPGRWRYDTMAKISMEERSDFVFALWLEGAIQGFAVTQDASHRHLGGGAVWHRALGPDWAALGPIGVAERVRGRGYGDALLAGALTGLKRRGARRCAIDWTDLDGFYGRHGFSIARRYRILSLELSP